MSLGHNFDGFGETEGVKDFCRGDVNKLNKFCLAGDFQKAEGFCYGERPFFPGVHLFNLPATISHAGHVSSGDGVIFIDFKNLFKIEVSFF